MSKMRILFAEDDPQMATAVITMVTQKFQSDVKIVWKPDGDLAFDEFKKGSYDLVISDLQMPSRSGIWLARQIRNTNSKVPIVLWTGAMTVPAHEEWLFNNILDKNFYPLLEVVEKFLNAKENTDV